MKNIFEIREGTPDDLDEVFVLVQELAVYEKSENEVITTPMEYRQLFNKGLFRTLIAQQNSEVIGIMVFFDAFSTWKGKMLWLEDFVIREKHRKKGLGSEMFRHLIVLAKSENYRLIKWEVLDWNEPAINFYKKMGARLETNWWDGKYFL